MTIVTEHFSTFSTVSEILIFSSYHYGAFSHYKEMSVIQSYEKEWEKLLWGIHIAMRKQRKSVNDDKYMACLLYVSYF